MKKTFCGWRDPDTGRARVAVELDGQRLEPPNDPLAVSEGYEFGYASSGPHNTAQWILFEVFGDSNHAAAFERDVISKVPHEGFRITEDQVRDWARNNS